MKKCNSCKIKKNFDEFHRNSKNIDGYKNTCKICRLAQQKKYRIKNKEILNEKQKQYYSNHKKEKSEYDKIYRKNNAEKIADKQKKYREANRDRKNIHEKIYNKRKPHIKAWRSLLHTYLRRINKKKTKSTLETLGYSRNELKEHLEKLFTEGMSWDNYGEWHIDHIKPISSFDKNTDPKIVNSLDNLQPLWKTTRVINGIKYIGNLNKASN